MLETDKKKMIKHLGEQIRQGRKKARISQKNLGERLGLSQPLVQQWECGKREPTAVTLLQISQILNTSFFIEEAGSIPAVSEEKTES